ncbi:MAG: GAF domain-containing protein [Bacteroidales bacterium]
MVSRKEQKEGRYARIYEQLVPLVQKTNVPLARMSTIVAVLHHKMEYFFWTGFYLLNEGDLVVGPYQGSLACQVLSRHTGVCWAAIDRRQAVVVPDVHAFENHIACDSRSNSEITIPLYDRNEEIIGVLDVDSKDFNSFDETDAQWLTKIAELVYRG